MGKNDFWNNVLVNIVNLFLMVIWDNGKIF